MALPLAVVVFLGAFVPLVGATVAGALVTNGVSTALIVAAVVVANQVKGDVLAPIVFGRALSLHPLVILLALAGGTVLAGLVGAVLSVPVAAVTWTVVRTRWLEEQPDPAASPQPAAPAGTVLPELAPHGCDARPR